MNNGTITTEPQIWGYNTQDLELANLIQGGCSFIATCIILIRVLDIPSFFRSVRDKRRVSQKKKEVKELERIKKLMNSLKHGDIDVADLLSDGDDDETETHDANYKIARKKKNVESKV